MPRTSYIIKREKKLVEKSSVADLPEYAGLVDVLSKYDVVNDKVLENDSTIDEPTLFTIKNTWPAIVTNAASEWQFFNFREKNSRCMLDSKKIKTEYYIKNQVNEKQLVVGSECVKHFGFENGVAQGVTSKSFIAQQQREQRKINRRENLKKLYGNVERRVDDYYTQISDSPVLFNSLIFQTATQKIDRMKQYIDNYIDSKENDATIYPQLQQDVQGYFDAVILPWASQRESELFACALEDVKHLEANGHVEVIEQLRDSDGLIDVDTVGYLYHLGFVGKHLKTFQERLAQHFRVISLTSSGLSIALESDFLAGIDYRVPFKSFLNLFGGVLFGRPSTLNFQDYYPS